MAEPLKFAEDVRTSLESFNNDYGTGWNLGMNYDSTGTQFETYINKYLFPKINETSLVGYELGNRFNFLSKEVENIGQYSEEYVILDAIPVNMNLSKKAELFFKENYARMASKLYGNGEYKKMKFTLNDNDARQNFSTLQDGIKYALGVFAKRVSDINISEEAELKAMIVDYSLRLTKEQRTVTSYDDLAHKLMTGILNLQNNSSKYNETQNASGGAIGRFTTKTNMKDMLIVTTDDVKSYLLDTKIANTFQVSGIDLTNRIISFDDLGGVFRLTDNVTISEADTITYFRAFGDYQIEIGDILSKGSMLTFDISDLDEFNGKIEEIKPKTEYFATLLDVRKIRYRRNTKNMLETSFRNGEFRNNTHWIHYLSSKQMSPFYNAITFQ